jgi:hypothetical protein
MPGQNPNTDAKIRRVVSCSGHSWYTNARDAADYLFNPVYMSYFLICVVLYATLMQPSETAEVPIQAQILVWGGLIMTSLIWLFLGLSLSALAVDRGMAKAIYMPLVLLPMVALNAAAGELILSTLAEQYSRSYGDYLENVIQNAIIIATFEILHAHFVAPQHSRYVDRRQIQKQNPASQTQTTRENTDWQTTAGSTTRTTPPQTLNVNHPEAARIEGSSLLSQDKEKKDNRTIVISYQTIDLADLIWIKSEDHYLSIQTKDKRFMLRGKLSLVVDELDASLGMQINRSAWVAYKAIRSVDSQEGGKAELHLEDGTNFSIAKARRLLFEQNYERAKASIGLGAI